MGRSVTKTSLTSTGTGFLGNNWNVTMKSDGGAISSNTIQVDNDNSNTSLKITNLPYAGGNGWDLSVPAIRIASWDLPSDTLWVSGHTGASEMAFHCNKDNANYVALPADSGGSMIVSFAYEIA